MSKKEACISLMLSIIIITCCIQTTEPNSDFTSDSKYSHQPSYQKSGLIESENNPLHDINPKVEKVKGNQAYNQIKNAGYSPDPPPIDLIICSQPLILTHQEKEQTINFEIYSCEPEDHQLNTKLVTVKINQTEVQIENITSLEKAGLYNITCHLPILEVGRYVLRTFYGFKEALNFKIVSVYKYTGNFSFVHWTDMHYDPPAIGFEKQLNGTIEAIKKINPDFIIMTGDLSCTNENWPRFYSILNQYNFYFPIFFVNGNHEKEFTGRFSDAVHYMGQESQLLDEYPFAFNYGNFSFIGVDSSSALQSEGDVSDIQYQWIEKELENNKNKTIITFCHHPLYFQGTSFWYNIDMAHNLLGLFATYNVTANFSGHIHCSNISYLNGVTYYTTVSAYNDTKGFSSEPYPPAGFRVIEVINSQIATSTVINTFNYYTGELVIQPNSLPD